MYLSRLDLDLRNRAVRRDLGDCQELHRTLLSGWPQIPGPAGARAQYGMLYRLETSRSGGRAALLVQSSGEPNWSRLPEGYLLNCAVKPADVLFDAVRSGTHFRFRLRANPTRRISTARGASQDRLAGKRVDLRGEEARVAWLERKGRERCGFKLVAVHAQPDVQNLRVQPEPNVQGRRNGDSLTFGAVLFEGELEVTDVSRFCEALEQGIGSGKAYGFGLLSVARST